MQQIGKMVWSAGLPVPDDLHNESYDCKTPSGNVNDDKKLQTFKTHKYIEAIKSLKTGIAMMIMHCTPTSENFKHRFAEVTCLQW